MRMFQSKKKRQQEQQRADEEYRTLRAQWHRASKALADEMSDWPPASAVICAVLTGQEPPPYVPMVVCRKCQRSFEKRKAVLFDNFWHCPECRDYLKREVYYRPSSYLGCSTRYFTQYYTECYAEWSYATINRLRLCPKCNVPISKQTLGSRYDYCGRCGYYFNRELYRKHVEALALSGMIEDYKAILGL